MYSKGVEKLKTRIFFLLLYCLVNQRFLNGQVVITEKHHSPCVTRTYSDVHRVTVLFGDFDNFH